MSVNYCKKHHCYFDTDYNDCNECIDEEVELNEKQNEKI